MTIPEHLRFHKFREGYFPPSLKMFGLVLGIFGGVLLYKENMVGILPLLVAVFFMITQNGHEFDLQQKTYLHYFGLLHFKFGKPIDVSKAKGVILEKTTVKENMQSRFGKNFKSQVKLWQVTLKIENGQECFVLETENIKHACTVSLLFMTTLQCPAYSKFVSKERILNYQLLRKGIVKFGETTILK